MALSLVTIEEEDFRLTNCSETLNFWNLELLHTIKSKNGEIRKEFKIEGYGMILESALKYIINYRIAKKYPNAITLKTYLNEYKKEMKILQQLCNGKI